MLKTELSPNFVICYEKYMASIAFFGSCDLLFYALWCKNNIAGAAHRPNRGSILENIDRFGLFFFLSFLAKKTAKLSLKKKRCSDIFMVVNVTKTHQHSMNKWHKNSTFLGVTLYYQ